MAVVKMMDQEAVNRAILRLAHEILEKNKDAENLALQGVSGRDIDGLVVAPDHESYGDGGVEGENCFLHLGNPGGFSVRRGD